MTVDNVTMHPLIWEVIFGIYLMSRIRTDYKKLFVRMLSLRKSRAKIDDINIKSLKAPDPHGYKKQLITILQSKDFEAKLNAMEYNENDYRHLIDLLNEIRAHELIEFMDRSKLLDKKPDKELIDLLGGRWAAHRILNRVATIDKTAIQYWYTGRNKMPTAWRTLILLIILS